jgi:hypothetical protein
VQVLPWADLDRRDAFRSNVGLGIQEGGLFQKRSRGHKKLIESIAARDDEPPVRLSIRSIRWMVFVD